MGMKPRRIVLLSVLAVVFLCGLLYVRIGFYGHYDGIYILKGERRGIRIVDDIMMGEEDRVLWGVYLRTVCSSRAMRQRIDERNPYLEYNWNKMDGSGFVRNVVPGGQKMVFCFSRFLDSTGNLTKGVFLGGGLPYSEELREKHDGNDTGVANFDGNRWYHIWCNANETIVTGKMLNRFMYPSRWNYDGSKVIEASRERLAVSSRHRVMSEDSQLGIDRFAFFEAGEPYFILAVRVKNIGQSNARYIWAYGDEPWLGNYGDCRGNVGWSAGRMHLYEGAVDTASHSYFGMIDVGNPLKNNSGTKFTYKANFIEWLGSSRPTRAYFSNQFGRYADENDKVPLTSEDNRVIALEYGPENLKPNDSRLYVLAIGKAYKNMEGFPVKPQVNFDVSRLDKLIAELQ